MIRVSVVISTYSKKRVKGLSSAIDSLNGQSLKPFEIILVLDPSPSLVDYYSSLVPANVKIVVSGKLGLSNARNAGIREAKGDIIAFIDDDAIADRDWIKNMAKNFEDPNVVGIGGLIIPVWENGCPSWFPEELNWLVGCSYKGLPAKKARVRNPIGCNMAFRKDCFERVGGFRSDIGRFGKTLLAGEEPELSMRMLEKMRNSVILHDPSAVVYHEVPKNRLSIRNLFLRSLYEGVSKALIYGSARKASKTLSAETEYVDFLISNAIPSKLKGIYKIENLCQLSLIFFLTATVLEGFILFSLFKFGALST